MLERLLIAGSGGQGIILAGKIIAASAVRVVPHVTFFPCYGAEVRGGASNGQVILSDTEIASPTPEKYDSMLIMNPDSQQAFVRFIRSAAHVWINTSLCKAPSPGSNRIRGIPASDMACQLGNIRTANFIMMGAYVAQSPWLHPAAVRQTIRHMLARKGTGTLDANLRAFDAGLRT